MYSNRPGIPPVPAYIYTNIHQTPALELHLANTYPSDQSGTCSHLLESLHPGRYRALPFMQSVRSPYPLPFSMNVKDKTVAAIRLTATMNYHSHPVIGADPGDSALLYVASWSSPKVLMAQTADPLSAVQEHVHPSFRPSLGEMQARLINRTAAGSASTLIRPYSHA